MDETEKKVAGFAEDTLQGEPAEETKEEAVLHAVKGGRQEEAPGGTAMIYVGPPVRGTILHSRFLIFEDGVPGEYKKDPVFKHLFVPPERLDQAQKELGRKESFRSIYYQRAIEATRRKGGE